MSAQNPETEPEAGASPPPPSGSWLDRLRAAWTNPANRFVVLFLVYLAALAFFYPRFSLRYAEVVEFMAVLTAKLSGGFLELIGETVKMKGKMVLYDGFAVEIIEECTGLYEMLIYTAAVLAFPTTLVKKGIGIALGVPILYAINVARIIFLLGVGAFYPETFDFMHLYFWQATLILMITSVWLLWIFLVVRRESPAHPA